MNIPLPTHLSKRGDTLYVPKKPRISASGASPDGIAWKFRQWQCATSDAIAVTGFGCSPRQAWDNWLLRYLNASEVVQRSQASGMVIRKLTRFPITDWPASGLLS